MAKKTEDGTCFRQSKHEKLFALVKEPNTGKVSIVVGNYKVSSKSFKSFNEAEAYISFRPYELIINTAVLFTELNRQNNENKEISKNSESNPENTESNQ